VRVVDDLRVRVGTREVAARWTARRSTAAARSRHRHIGAVGIEQIPTAGATAVAGLLNTISVE
jgi:hypothetical protein